MRRGGAGRRGEVTRGRQRNCSGCLAGSILKPGYDLFSPDQSTLAFSFVTIQPATEIILECLRVDAIKALPRNADG